MLISYDKTLKNIIKSDVLECSIFNDKTLEISLEVCSCMFNFLWENTGNIDH